LFGVNYDSSDWAGYRKNGNCCGCNGLTVGELNPVSDKKELKLKLKSINGCQLEDRLFPASAKSQPKRKRYSADDGNPLSRGYAAVI
jgi:hypothetical protein